MHCDPLMNKLVGYLVPSHFYRIDTNGGEPIYDPRKGLGLALDAKRMEAFELPISFRPDPRNFSISLWVKQVNNPQQYCVIVPQANRKGTAGWSLDAHARSSRGGSVSFSILNEEGTQFMSPSAPISDHTFTQIVGTFDGSSIKTFENGRLLGKYVSDPNIPSRIGTSAYRLTCNWWSGIIKELRIYDKTIDQTEIQELFANDLPEFVTNGLVGYWTFNGNLKDISGHNNQGVINSMIPSMTFRLWLYHNINNIYLGFLFRDLN